MKASKPWIIRPRVFITLLFALAVAVFVYLIYTLRPPSPLNPEVQQLPTENQPDPGPQGFLPQPVPEPETSDSLRILLSELPTTEDLSRLGSDEVHRAPPALLQIAEKFGQLEEELERRPEMKEDLLSFFQACALKEDVALTVRTLCFSNWKSLGGTGDLPVTQEVRSLAERL